MVAYSEPWLGKVPQIHSMHCVRYYSIPTLRYWLRVVRWAAMRRNPGSPYSLGIGIASQKGRSRFGATGFAAVVAAAVAAAAAVVVVAVALDPPIASAGC